METCTRRHTEATRAAVQRTDVALGSASPGDHSSAAAVE
jgi:hypothetical protein